MDLLAEPKLESLKMERTDKLKIFAVSCMNKKVPREIVDNNFTLAIAITYTPAEAILSARESFNKLGKNPDDYVIPFMILGREVEGIIEQPKQFPMIPDKVAFCNNCDKTLTEYQLFKQDHTGCITPGMYSKYLAKQNQKKGEEKEEKKKPVDIISYIRYVFAEVGTPSQMRVAEAVITKFADYVSKKDKKYGGKK